MVTNVIVAGLGGQGVLKVTDILSEALFRCGYDIKKSEVHGMSQRGGSVSSEVRFGENVASPMVPAGECDYLVVLDITQVEVVKDKLREGGVLITPDDVPKEKLTNPKALNTMLLGALSAKLPVEEKVWKEVLADIFPEGSEIPPRLSHRFRRLGALAVRMMLELREEAQCSSFRPLLFEYEPSEGDPSRPEPWRIPLSDGTSLSLIGKIDRVDVFHKDGNAYLRIVDYKTGKKTFSRSSVEKGKNLQLLIYLFTMWRSKRPDFLRAIGAEGGAVLPAGALYLNLSLSPTRLDRPSDVPPPLATRSGIFLNDDTSLDAMDPRTPKILIPLKYDKDGNLADAEHLATLEEMGELANDVERVVCHIGESIRAGRADATPLTTEAHGPCDYCRFSPVCRNVGGGVKVDD